MANSVGNGKGIITALCNLRGEKYMAVNITRHDFI